MGQISLNLFYYLTNITTGVGETIKQNEKILEQNEQLLALLKEQKGLDSTTITKKSSHY